MNTNIILEKLKSDSLKLFKLLQDNEILKKLDDQIKLDYSLYEVIYEKDLKEWNKLEYTINKNKIKIIVSTHYSIKSDIEYLFYNIII